MEVTRYQDKNARQQTEKTALVPTPGDQRGVLGGRGGAGVLALRVAVVSGLPETGDFGYTATEQPVPSVNSYGS